MFIILSDHHSVVDTSDKFITGVADTSEQLSTGTKKLKAKAWCTRHKLVQPGL
jgi:hypothetical protein